MSVNLPPLLALYSWRNTGKFGNYDEWKLGAKWAVAPYYETFPRPHSAADSLQKALRPLQVE
jgi:hypothetical protein